MINAIILLDMFAQSMPSAIDEFISVQPMHGGETGYIELNVVKSNRRSLTADVALYHQDGRLSALMKGARITISSTLNAAFVPHGARGETANEEATQ